MKLIIDAMGGDNAPLEIVKGALSGQKRWGVDVTLTGDTTAILQALEACGEKTLPQGMEIVHTTETVEMCDDPATVFRRKKDTSMGVGLTMLRDGRADAMVSAGSTGALLTGATLIVKRIRGIRRAAMAPVIPTTTGQAVLIDCGANAECTPEYLVQFAYLGSYYAHRVLGVERPRVGLLNIGTEDSKGTDLQKETLALAAGGPHGGTSELHRQHRGQGGHQGRVRRHRLRRLLRQCAAENHGGRRLFRRKRPESHVQEEPADQAGGPVRHAGAATPSRPSWTPIRWAVPPSSVSPGRSSRPTAPPTPRLSKTPWGRRCRWPAAASSGDIEENVALMKVERE